MFQGSELPTISVRTLATDYVGPCLCLVQAFFKALRPCPDRPKMGTDVEFGTLNVPTAALGRSAGYDLRQVGRSDTNSLCPGAHSGLERVALLLSSWTPPYLNREVSISTASQNSVLFRDLSQQP